MYLSSDFVIYLRLRIIISEAVEAAYNANNNFSIWVNSFTESCSFCAKLFR